jgi:hypothetical protein
MWSLVLNAVRKRRCLWTLPLFLVHPIGQSHPISPSPLAPLLNKASSVLTRFEFHTRLPAVHLLGLHTFSKLRVLKLEYMFAKELPALPPQLEELHINTQLDEYDDDLTIFASISSISALPRLRVLAMGYADSLQDLTPLEACVALESFSLWECTGVQQWPDFNALVALTRLDLSFSPLESLDPFRSLQTLRQLSLTNFWDLASLDGLRGCSQLTKLNLKSCPSVSSLEGLQGCTRLADLCTPGCRVISSLQPLRFCSQLTKLDMSYCRALSNLEGLQGCSQLTDLHMGECSSLSSLSGIHGCILLTTLNLHDCTSISSLEGLQGCTRLYDLAIQRCSSIASLQPLPSCLLLNELTINGCVSISSLEPLIGLPKLSVLRIEKHREAHLLGTAELRAKGVLISVW